MSNTERIATYVTGLSYPKPKQQHVKQNVAWHLTLLDQRAFEMPVGAID